MKSGSNCTCSSFSCTVIFASRAFTRASTPAPAGCRIDARAASSADCVPAITPPAVTALSATTDTMIMARRQKLVIPSSLPL
jgi:hypothetical protein